MTRGRDSVNAIKNIYTNSHYKHRTNCEIVIDTSPHQMAKTRLVPSEDVPHGL